VSEAVCNLCTGDKKFAVPWSGTTPADAISKALMEEHLREAHGVTGL
jgi:hypothetical protein